MQQEADVSQGQAEKKGGEVLDLLSDYQLRKKESLHEVIYFLPNR
jgi:hypothetical protein